MSGSRLRFAVEGLKKKHVTLNDNSLCNLQNSFLFRRYPSRVDHQPSLLRREVKDGFETLMSLLYVAVTSIHNVVRTSRH